MYRKPMGPNSCCFIVLTFLLSIFSRLYAAETCSWKNDLSGHLEAANSLYRQRRSSLQNNTENSDPSIFDEIIRNNFRRSKMSVLFEEDCSSLLLHGSAAKSNPSQSYDNIFSKHILTLASARMSAGGAPISKCGPRLWCGRAPDRQNHGGG
ncbi:hypothetical protein CEXT_8201 [Caerostris extrusa]|uniref:Uncharacterized protein n=1 Tax=Caerostris extrusa TaxID=172846 RepID=A0AAV4Q7J7_CAEEX|nr:hypothetical protein CEXT_8201 [Caerostris extrusa]